MKAPQYQLSSISKVSELFAETADIKVWNLERLYKLICYSDACFSGELAKLWMVLQSQQRHVTMVLKCIMRSVNI